MKSEINQVISTQTTQQVDGEVSEFSFFQCRNNDDDRKFILFLYFVLISQRKWLKLFRNRNIFILSLWMHYILQFYYLFPFIKLKFSKIKIYEFLSVPPPIQHNSFFKVSKKKSSKKLKNFCIFFLFKTKLKIEIKECEKLLMAHIKIHDRCNATRVVVVVHKVIKKTNRKKMLKIRSKRCSHGSKTIYIWHIMLIPSSPSFITS